jgi:hypothetical protein
MQGACQGLRVHPIERSHGPHRPANAFRRCVSLNRMVDLPIHGNDVTSYQNIEFFVAIRAQNVAAATRNGT